MTDRASVVEDARPASDSTARERVLEAAYELFSQRGIRAVGIDAIIQRSGVARMTLYRHFASKDALVLAFLERRENRWTRDWLQQEVTTRASDPGDRLLAIFDVFDGWFQQPDFEGCSFINILLEITDRSSDVRAATVGYLARIRSFVEALAVETGATDPAGLAHKWHILMKGSIVAAGEGDREAARRAKQVAALVLRDAQGAQSVAPTGRALT